MIINDLDHPNGTYACLVPDSNSIKQLQSLQNMLDLSSPVLAKDLHMTVIYSRKPCPSVAELSHGVSPINGKIAKLGYLPTQHNTTCLVAEVECPDAVGMHHSICKAHGASHDYPTYLAHITLSYDCKMGIKELLHPLKIVFDQFKVSALDPKWQSKN